MKRLSLVAGLACALLAPTAGGAMEAIRVSALRSGAIKIDGAMATIVDLKAALEHMRAAHGGVMYYREGAEQAPTDAQDSVFKAIMDARLPVSLSSKPDFSDYIDGDGHSQPRH